MKVENENTAITLSEATKAMLQDRIIIILTIDACCKFLFYINSIWKKKKSWAGVYSFKSLTQWM